MGTDTDHLFKARQQTTYFVYAIVDLHYSQHFQINTLDQAEV